MKAVLNVLVLLVTAHCFGEDIRPVNPANFARENLVAWCIVPFDAKQRSPAERAEMLERIGIRHFAYDWRAQHLPTFETELDALAHKIELTAVWFPGAVNADARTILDALAKHKLHPQLWVSAGLGPQTDAQKAVENGAAVIRPIAVEAAKIGSTVALYNHGGWFGDVDHQIAVIERLKQDKIENVKIVYNFNHATGDAAHVAETLAKVKPYLVALNLNGMNRADPHAGESIVPLGQGDRDLEILKAVRDLNFSGPIGILNHTNLDAELRLLDNIEGLAWLAAQLDGTPAGKPPVPRTYKAPAK